LNQQDQEFGIDVIVKIGIVGRFGVVAFGFVLIYLSFLNLFGSNFFGGTESGEGA
jgi:hypothetical protein